jgi:acetylornithine/N-succinyldiaminopimelate aminotransferase
MRHNQISKTFEEYVMPTYIKTPVVFVKGRGSEIIDLKTDKYLDFFSGWVVSGLGHCHPKVVAAVKDQVRKIIHVPNNYYSIQQAKLAKKIIEHSFPGKVFFCNSGAEANECAIKIARAYGNPARHQIISMKNSFHGRTLATLTLTGQEKYQKGFEPLPEGFKTVPFNDIAAIQRAITDKTIAIIVEPIQGEGGINIADKEYLEQLRLICNEKNILLMFDEVQTGMGRTGKWFAYQNYNVQPDVMTLAKTLGGGLPIGAVVASKKVSDILKAGMHASTFGGSPLVCAASLAVFKAIEKERLLSNVLKMSDYLFEKLNILKNRYPVIKQIRGMGLMIGVELNMQGRQIVEMCFEKKLLINCTQDNVLRLMPALIVKKKEIDRAIDILDEVFSKIEK